MRATRTSLPRWVRTGGTGRLAPRVSRAVRTRYAYQPRAFGTYRVLWPPRCKLAHGNQPLLEGLIFALQRQARRPTCAECHGGYAELKARWANSSTRNPRWKWGVDKEWMAAVVLRGCCAGAAARAEAEGSGAAPTPGAGLAIALPPLALPPSAPGLARAREAEQVETPKLAALLAEARAQQRHGVPAAHAGMAHAAARAAAHAAGMAHTAAGMAHTAGRQQAHAGRGVLARRNHSFGGAGARRNHSWAQGAGWAGWAERHHPRRRSQLNASRGLARAEMRRASARGVSGGGAAAAPCPDCVPATRNPQ